MAEPSLLKYNSLAMALIFVGRDVRKTTLSRLVREIEDMDAKDDNLLSTTRPQGAAIEPTEDMLEIGVAIKPTTQLQETQIDFMEMKVKRR